MIMNQRYMKTPNQTLNQKKNENQVKANVPIKDKKEEGIGIS